VSARLRQALPWVLVLAGLLAAALIGGRRPDEGVPLDPASPGPLGTKALVDVLRELGAQVSVGDAPPAEGGTALLLSDNLDPAARNQLLGWVHGGGTLVVADPGSPISHLEVAGRTTVGLVEAQLQRRCEEPALQGAGRVSAPGGVLFKVPRDGQGCFRRGDGAWLVVQPSGLGNLVRLGGSSALVNRELGKADNAVVIVSLLAPKAGTRAVVLRPPPPGGGSRSLTDLIAPRVKLFGWQLVVAFVLLALWRARRLGRPVREPQPVQLEGSELVVAVGHLLQRARGRGQAAGLLSDDLRRLLAERLGLPASAPPEQVAEAAAARSGIPVERLRTALAPTTPPRDEAELVALAYAVDAVRREVTSVR
jgi:Domain of unknown function (DUF4350)